MAVDPGELDLRQPSSDPPVAPSRPGPSPAALAAAERRRAEMAQSRARSERIKRLRRTLPWVMAAMALIVAGWVGVRAVLTGLAAQRATTGTVRMIAPRFYGRDSKGKSYLLRATDAVRDTQEPDKVQLNQPHMTVDATSPKPIVITARQGQYREQSGTLFLYGDVLMQDGAGYRFRSEHAAIDTRKGTTSGDTNVTGEGPLGRIASSTYSVYEGGARTVFSGGVRGHLYNNGGKGDAAAPAASGAMRGPQR